MERKSTLLQAVEAVRSGGVIAYPTEGVYGLGCDPQNDSALQRIVDIKGRDSHKGFILVASTQTQLHSYIAPIQAEWQIQFDKFWPGPVTFIVPVAVGVSNLVSGYRDTVAVRVSDHPVIQKLCNLYGGAIVSTSANRSGSPALRTAAEVRTEFGSTVDVVIDDQLGDLTTPTTIVDVRTGIRVR